MAYQRKDLSFHGAFTRICSRLGYEWLAESMGVSVSRLEQMSNPARKDLAVLVRSVSMDVEAARSGAGCPLYEEYGRQLRLAGVALDRATDRRLVLEVAIRSALGFVRQAADLLEAVLVPGGAVPRLATIQH
ncbi:hypothetical protein [Kiloniella laminariae]|uniref:hypothetical protein n=1 Tax=Kiloniella laminariae TaxID=454162 RepID=UPI0003676943|nr:hypothetical protein [Kiloniella laminariae]